MNCKKFALIVHDLARDQMIEPSTRQSALAHAESCPQCGARLGNERVLTAGLRALAASESYEQAPEHVEATLLAAFRQQATTSNVAPGFAAARANNAFWWTRWAIAAAAAMLLVTLTVIVTRLHHSPLESAPVRRTENAPHVRPTETPKVPEQSSAIASTKYEGAPRSAAPKLVQRRAPYRMRRNARRDQPAGDARLMVGEIGEINVTASVGPAEVATDYLPLSYASNLNPVESGQVVRVVLPRSALISFGLPMNAERAGETVKAEVLLGDDGQARAIRFVH